MTIFLSIPLTNKNNLEKYILGPRIQDIEFEIEYIEGYYIFGIFICISY